MMGLQMRISGCFSSLYRVWESNVLSSFGDLTLIPTPVLCPPGSGSRGAPLNCFNPSSFHLSSRHAILSNARASTPDSSLIPSQLTLLHLSNQVRFPLVSIFL